MIIDLSQPIENGMTYYPGDPEPRIAAANSEPPWQVSELHLGTHTGTHIDAATHFIPGGATIDSYPLERFMLPGVVVPVVGMGGDEAIPWRALSPYVSGLPSGAALVLHTGWDRYWGTERYLEHPFLAEAAARELVSAGIGLVATDALNVDSTPREASLVHEILLGADVLIVENLRGLDQLTPGETYTFSFLPLRLKGLDGSPIRAVAWQER